MCITLFVLWSLTTVLFVTQESDMEDDSDDSDSDNDSDFEEPSLPKAKYAKVCVCNRAAPAMLATLHGMSTEL